jgi:hypothetical protein
LRPSVLLFPCHVDMVEKVGIIGCLMIRIRS